MSLMNLQRTGGREAPDPVERIVPLALRIVLYCFLSYLLYQASVAFSEYHVGKSWPFFLSVFRMFTFLPIHEAGHFFFRPFGWTLMVLGGSILQVALPLAWFILAAVRRSQAAPFPLFWVGENLMDVSLYMRDAPVRMLPLLGGDTAGHDWFNLFRHWGILDSADVIADCVYFTGFAVALCGIAAGFAWAVIAFYRTHEMNFTPVEDRADSSREIEDMLNTSLEKKNRSEIGE